MRTRAVPVAAGSSDLALRDQLSNLRGLLALSMLMTERGTDEDIVYLAATAVPSFARCRIEGVYLDGVGWQKTPGSPARPAVRADASGQLLRLGEAGGAMALSGQGWGWAFPLRSLAGHIGHLVVTADGEPSPSELLLLRALAQQTGIALANARLHARERAVTADLRTANAALAHTVEELQRKTAIHDRFTQVAVAGEGQQGIARVLHELTGFPAAVEDPHGNLLAWTGSEPARPRAKSSPARREHVLERAVRAGRPIRADGCLLTVARPHADVLGVLLLVDPDGLAGKQETVALEHGATVLAMELAWLRSVADTELRLGRDVVADLIGGTDDAGALGRARALGYDLGRPHRVVVVEQPDPGGDPDALLQAVRQAVGGTSPGALLMSRAGAVVVLAACAPGAVGSWAERFRGAVLGALGGRRAWVGVGGVCHEPADFPRSHREAQLALRLQHSLRGPDRAIAYDDLGVYQLLSEVSDTGGVERFVRRWLGDLLDYDAQRGTELVLTLSRYLECGGSYDATARGLAIGRSTVKYRLQRIRQISGHDLSHPDTRFNLHLAARAWCTLRAL